MLRKIWTDEAGFVISTELILVATVLVIGMLVGMVTLRDQVVQELGDVADAISEVTQSYSFTSISGHTSSTAGSTFNDTEDFCDVDANDNALSSNEPQCIDVSFGADMED